MNVIDGNISFAQIANFSIAFVIVVAGLLSVFYIIKGGFSFITSAGDEEKIKAAVHTVRYAIVGLFVVFLSVLIVNIIGGIFGFDFFSYLSWENISKMMSLILDRIKLAPGQNTGMTGVLD
jgi:hypothetical protein